MSLAKFSNRHVHRGKRLHWARAEEDGLPYRGAYAPMMTETEFEERVVKVADPHAETFDLSREEHKLAYLEVLDGVANGWFQCLYVERWHTEANVNGFVRIEWVEYFLEDGTRTPYVTHSMMELAHGQQSLGLPLLPSSH